MWEACKSDLERPNPCRQELRKLGWIEGQTITAFVLRSAEGREERLPAMVVDINGSGRTLKWLKVKQVKYRAGGRGWDLNQ